MDFAKLNTADVAEAGEWLHLRHPNTDELLYKDDKAKKKPCRIRVRGNESRSIQKCYQQIERLKAKNKKFNVEQAGEMLARAMVVDMENIERAGVALTASSDDIKWLFDQSASFSEQVLEFSRERGNFLAKSASD